MADSPEAAGPAVRGSAWRTRLTSVALLAVSSLVALAMAEVVVRVLAPQPRVEVTPGLYVEDPPRRFRLNPGFRGRVTNGVEFDTSVQVNEHGLRDEEVTRRDPEIRRFLILGDSFVFGWGVEREETLVERLEARLAGTEVWNGGVAGFGLPDQADWFETYGLALEPDLVILGVFLGNDLLDATEQHRRIEMRGGLVSEQGAATGLRAWLFRHSHLIRLGKSALPVPLQARLRAMVGLPEPRTLAYLRDALGSYALEPPPLIEEGRAASQNAFARLHQLCLEASISLVVALLPDPLQVDEDRWSLTLEALVGDLSHHDPEVPGIFFSGLASRHAVPVLDLLPAFRRASQKADGERLFFRHDPHFTPAGHELAADELAGFLAQLTEPAG